MWGGAYQIGPGVVVTGGQIWWGAEENLDAAASENDSIELILGIVIKF